MRNKLAAALVVACLPGTAAAWEWGTASAGGLDLFYIPSYTDDLGTEFQGDGFGLRGTFKVHQWVATLIEHSRVSYDSGSDFEQSRVGVGVTLDSGTGIFVEYANDRLDSVKSDGLGVRGRVMARALPDVQVYADLGQAKLENTAGEYDELFYSVGGTFSITEQWGFFADYKVSLYDRPDSSSDRDIEQARLGVSMRLDY